MPKCVANSGIARPIIADPLTISFVTRYQAAVHIIQVDEWGTSARAHVHTPFPYLGNGWTDCTEIRCLLMNQLAMHFILATSGVCLHVLTCVPLFLISGSSGSITLKYGVLLDPLAMRFTQATSGGYT